MELKDLEQARQTYAKKIKKFIIIGLSIFAFAIITGLLSFAGTTTSRLSSALISLPAVGIFLAVVSIMTMKQACQKKS